jgi:hypothetical protein
MEVSVPVHTRQLRDTIGTPASSSALADFDDELELLDWAVS